MKLEVSEGERKNLLISTNNTLPTMKKFLPFVLILFLSFQANSAIIYHNTEITLNQQNLTWDINEDGNEEFRLEPFTYRGGTSNILHTSSDIVSERSGIANQIISLVNLSKNFSVAETLTGNYEWINESGGFIVNHLGYFLDTPIYLGIRFDHNNNGTNDGFAWVKLTYSKIGTIYNIISETITIHEWAYDDSGNPIFVGQTQTIIPEIIPEPTTSSLALLALAGLGKRRLRRKD